MKKHYKKVIALLCFLLCIGGIGIFIKEHLNKKNNNDIYEEIQDQMQIDEPDKESEVEEPEVIEIPIDFASLKEINDEIYAWIDIEDTNIHYPIVQSATDDSYYLEHTIEGVKGYPGSIYTESINRKDFSDFNTLIYGHDMKDGTMFKHLHKFANADFFESHDTIMIYTETEIKTYKVYAAVVYDNRHIMYNFDKDNIEDRKAFIESLHNARNMKNQYRENMTIDENSKLITLSTCITGQPDKRFIVVAAESNPEN